MTAVQAPHLRIPLMREHLAQVSRLEGLLRLEQEHLDELA